MAGGPLYPYSVYPNTAGGTFYWTHVYSTAANSNRETGLGVMGSPTSDCTWVLRFRLPPQLPSGTMKLSVLTVSSAATGALKFDTRWNRLAVSADPSTLALNNEGSSTITFAVKDRLLETKVTLDATAAVASDIIAMNLDFLTSGSSVADVTTHIPAIIWE
jgi:hypothetical protein